MKLRTMYWITPNVGESHRERAKMLLGKGIVLEFAYNVQECLTLFRLKRCAVIILGDEGGREELKHSLLTLTTMPELTGVRLVLSISQHFDDIHELATLHSFRDMIPFDWETPRWIQRFLFSTYPAAVPQMTTNSISSVAIPARIDWISEYLVRLETRLTAPVGTRLKLAGKIAETLGLKSLSLAVVQTQKSDLRFRFSDALLCSWEVPSQIENRRVVLLNHLSQITHGTPLKVFLAVRTPEVRDQIVKALNIPGFVVVSALHKHSLVQEPKYFNPHLICIDHQMCQPRELATLKELLHGLSPDTRLMVIGPQSCSKELTHLAPGHRIFELAKIPVNLPDVIQKRMFEQGLPKPHARIEPDAIYIPSDSDYSNAEIQLAARMTSIHPTAVQFHLPYPAGNFGLCRVDSPFLNKLVNQKIYVKITDAYVEPKRTESDFQYVIETVFCNILSVKRKALTDGLVATFAEQIDAQQMLRQAKQMEVTSLEQKVAQHVDQRLLMTGTQFEEIISSGNFTDRMPFEEPAESVSVPETPLSQKPLKPYRDKDAESVRLLGWVLFSFLVFCTGLYLSMNYLAPNYQRSGSNYSDQLNKFKSRGQTPRSPQNP